MVFLIIRVHLVVIQPFRRRVRYCSRSDGRRRCCGGREDKRRGPGRALPDGDPSPAGHVSAELRASRIRGCIRTWRPGETVGQAAIPPESRRQHARSPRPHLGPGDLARCQSRMPRSAMVRATGASSSLWRKATNRPVWDIHVSGADVIGIQHAEVGDPAHRQMLWPLRLTKYPRGP